MAYKLALDDLVGVKIEGKNRAKDGTEKPFKFVLVCDRYSNEQLMLVIKDQADVEAAVIAFFEKITHDWQGQKLVLDEEGNPAPFNVDALQVLMSIRGMPMLCWQSYSQQAQATVKN